MEIHNAPLRRKPENRVYKSRPTAPVRRSARLHQVEARLKEGNHQLPSLSPSSTVTVTPERLRAQKRKRLLSNDPGTSKRPRSGPEPIVPTAEHLVDPIACWASTTFWPKSFGEEACAMSLNQSESQREGQSLNRSGKRKSEWTHYSAQQERLAQHGVYMNESTLIQRSSKFLCKSFLAGDRLPTQLPCYPLEQVDNVLARIRTLNEPRLFRDVTPWVVPSAENLFFSSEIAVEYIREELDALWIKCATMGSTTPKPDYTAGLSHHAFSSGEVDKLHNYSSSEKPFFFTANFCFPFLICEAKPGLSGMAKADFQNIHSGSIAVRAILELYKAAFGSTDPNRVNQLYGQVLVFTVSHDNEMVKLYGHYAVLRNTKLEFYRYNFAVFSLVMDDGADRYKAYNFVRNVYEKFAPEHRVRIQTAAAALPAPGPRTGISFTTSALNVTDSEEDDSQEPASQDDRVFKKPRKPASALGIRGLEQQMANLIRQMEQQKQESKEREEKMKQESKEREEKHERQMEQQRQESKEQMDQLKEVVSLLKQAQEKC
ncbi:MAG: hypothetical protein M1826_004931 [Phylliscum demangeonii]|nr:MAG: hypothetical protein M1826_004931 [Phylliscum demangeonii]